MWYRCESYMVCASWLLCGHSLLMYGHSFLPLFAALQSEEASLPYQDTPRWRSACCAVSHRLHGWPFSLTEIRGGAHHRLSCVSWCVAYGMYYPAVCRPMAPSPQRMCIARRRLHRGHAIPSHQAEEALSLLVLHFSPGHPSSLEFALVAAHLQSAKSQQVSAKSQQVSSTGSSGLQPCICSIPYGLPRGLLLESAILQHAQL